MKIPKIISKNNHEYIFIEEYKNFILYQDMLTGAKECFLKYEIEKINKKR